jgi:protein ImuA
MARDMMSALRRTLAALEQRGVPSAPELFSLGCKSIDEGLGGGLVRGGLHELYANEAVADAGAVAGFGLGVSLRAAGGRPLLWVRQRYVDTEAGWLYGAGLSAFGLDPAQLILLRARDPTATLRAAAEGARCAALGAVIVEIWGEPPVLDQKASRRLVLLARQSGLPLIMIRLDAKPVGSAASSRWSVSSCASTALEANAPGRPSFSVRLLRHRAGITGQWSLEWDRDHIAFAEPAPLSRPVAAVPPRQPAATNATETSDPTWRRTA